MALFDIQLNKSLSYSTRGWNEKDKQNWTHEQKRIPEKNRKSKKKAATDGNEIKVRNGRTDFDECRNTKPHSG